MQQNLIWKEIENPTRINESHSVVESLFQNLSTNKIAFPNDCFQTNKFTILQNIQDYRVKEERVVFHVMSLD